MLLQSCWPSFWSKFFSQLSSVKKVVKVQCVFGTQSLSEGFLSAPLSSLHSLFNPSGKGWPAQGQWPLECCELRAEKAFSIWLWGWWHKAVTISQSCCMKKGISQQLQSWDRGLWLQSPCCACLGWTPGFSWSPCIVLSIWACRKMFLLASHSQLCPSSPVGILICKTNNDGPEELNSSTLFSTDTWDHWLSCVRPLMKLNSFTSVKPSRCLCNYMICISDTLTFLTHFLSLFWAFCSGSHDPG